MVDQPSRSVSKRPWSLLLCWSSTASLGQILPRERERMAFCCLKSENSQIVMPALGAGIHERHGKTIVDGRDIGERGDAVL